MEEQKEPEIVKDMENDRKEAERYVLNYESLRKSYEVRREEWLESGKPPAPNESIGGGKSNLPGKPVEDKAIKAAQYDLDQPEYFWLRAVEIALKTFGERKRIFIAVRREAEKKKSGGVGRPGWVGYTQYRYSERIRERFVNDDGMMNERTIRRWWRYVLDRVVEINLRLKFIKK